MGTNPHSDCTLIERYFLSLYFLLNFPNSNNQFASQIWMIIFDPQFFLLYSIMLDWFLSKHSILHLAVNCLRKCASTDPQSKYLPLKLPKNYHYEIFWCDWFLTLPLCALLSETVYYIWFSKKISCLHIGISVLRWLVIHLLVIHQ